MNDMIRKVYSCTPLMYELVKTLVGRETAFLSKGKGASFRNIKAHKVDYLVVNFKGLGFFTKKLNIYNSVAYIENMPMFSFNPDKRKEQGKEFNNDFDTYHRGSDFVIDVDFKGDFDKTYAETKEVVELFDELKLPYYVKFTGNGFHIVIPYVFIPLSNIGGMERTFSEVATAIQEILDLSLMDTDVYDEFGELKRVGIYDKRRVVKASYSLDVTTGRMCYPLSKEQFETFSYDMASPEYVLKLNLRNRGLQLQNETTGKSFVDLINYLKGE